MIGFFGSVTFKTSDKRICTFNNLKRSISGSYSEHKRYTKKSQREFEGPENQSVTFENASDTVCFTDDNFSVNFAFTSSSFPPVRLFMKV